MVAIAAWLLFIVSMGEDGASASHLAAREFEENQQLASKIGQCPWNPGR